MGQPAADDEAPRVGRPRDPRVDDAIRQATLDLLVEDGYQATTIQAIARSDLTLLLRTGLGYLPLAMLVVAVAAPVTTLLLSGSDELSRLVERAAGEPGVAA